MVEYFSALVSQHGMIAVLASFGIGILTSLAPCSIAALPLIVGFAANTNVEDDARRRKQFTRQFTFVFVAGVILSLTLLFLLMTQFKTLINTSPIMGFIFAGALSIYVALSGLGVLRGFSFDNVAKGFAKYRLYGAFVMGVLIGVISSPCASPAIATILIVAQGQTLFSAFLLVMAFALGHSVVLIFAGLSINFVQWVGEQKSIQTLSSIVQKSTAVFLLLVGIYFIYKAIILGTL